jgi:hypothetical protein
MRTYIVLIPSVTLFFACGTPDKFESRATTERSNQANLTARTIDKAPKWMEKLPESKDAVYASGSGVSRDFSMADEKAKSIAFGQLCTAAGGEIDKQSTIFLTDTEDTSKERSELVIRSMCRGVDITGAEVVEIKRIAEGSRYRSYALVALPIGEANVLGTNTESKKSAANLKQRADRALKELDENIRR